MSITLAWVPASGQKEFYETWVGNSTTSERQWSGTPAHINRIGPVVELRLWNAVNRARAVSGLSIRREFIAGLVSTGI